jgi:FkbM family methyltransferase
MTQKMLNIYRYIFCRKFFHRFNYHAYRIALRGIGVLNSEGSGITGESYLLKKISENISIKTIIDVGANTGGYSQELRMRFSKAAIYAIEPHPETFKILSAFAKKNRIYAYKQGLGDHIGKEKLWDFANDAVLKHTQPTSTLASTLRKVVEDFHKQKAQSYVFEMDTLDNFTKKKGIRKIDFLKIDVEGAELSVLRGARNLLKNNNISFIQFEFNEMNAYSRTLFKDFINILPNHIFYRIMPNDLYKMGIYRPNTHEIFAFQNILAVSRKYQAVFDKF